MAISVSPYQTSTSTTSALAFNSRLTAPGSWIAAGSTENAKIWGAAFSGPPVELEATSSWPVLVMAGSVVAVLVVTPPVVTASVVVTMPGDPVLVCSAPVGSGASLVMSKPGECSVQPARDTRARARVGRNIDIEDTPDGADTRVKT
ncbi:MAG TPA: hypothetical protein VGB85_10000 [Nannocystis sp.]